MTAVKLQARHQWRFDDIWPDPAVLLAVADVFLRHKPNRHIPPQQLMPVAMENKKYIRFKIKYIQTKIR